MDFGFPGKDLHQWAVAQRVPIWRARRNLNPDFHLTNLSLGISMSAWKAQFKAYAFN